MQHFWLFIYGNTKGKMVSVRQKLDEPATNYCEWNHTQSKNRIVYFAVIPQI
jgi:hypothetical protein